jgi:hypothetical protein
MIYCTKTILFQIYFRDSIGSILFNKPFEKDTLNNDKEKEESKIDHKVKDIFDKSKDIYKQIGR